MTAIANGGGVANLTGVPQTIYTVPNGLSAAVLLSAMVVNTSESIGLVPKVFRRRASVPDAWIGPGTSLAVGSTAKLNPSTLDLLSGDLLMGYVDAASAGPACFGAAYPVALNSTLLGQICGLSVNAAGTTIIVYAKQGIYRSTNDGKTWAKVYGTAANLPTSHSPHAYINSTFFFYKSATSALKSTDDGLTWTLDTGVTNAPQAICAAGGNIAKNGTTFAGLNSAATAMVTTTNGIAWTVQTAFPSSAAVKSLCFSGTNYVAQQTGASANVFTSTNGASWATNTGGGTSTVSSALASNGAGTVVDAANSYISINHGVTWTTLAAGGVTVGTYGDENCLFFSGSAFIAAGTGSSSNVLYSLTSAGDLWASTNERASAANQSMFIGVLASGKCISVAKRGGSIGGANCVQTSADLLFTPSFGLQLTVSTSEMTL